MWHVYHGDQILHTIKEKKTLFLFEQKFKFILATLGQLCVI